LRSIKNRIEYILKHNLMIQKTYKLVMSLFFRFLSAFIVTDEKLILFNSLSRKYNDSPKAIFNYMIGNEAYKDFKYVWAVDEPEKYDIPNCAKVKMDTMKYFITALKAKYWVSCVNIERGLHFKKRKTRYLNTWHGTPLKLIGNAVPGRNDFDFSDIDVFCYAGEYEKKIYKRDFKILEDNLILSGLPRNDELYSASSQQIKDYKRLLNLPEDKKIILYAPTWRDSKDNGISYSLAPPLDIELWQRELKDEYVILLRTHAYTNKLLGVEFNDFVRDFSNYPVINHLLIVSDILISDYSATIFDYSILSRPILCYGYDYDEYKLTRGFYIDLEKELPNGVIKSQDLLLEKIKSIDYKTECKKTESFKDRYIEVSGNATAKCVKALIR
jgi:CDP-glycerol glycerophosphotransferase